MLSPLARPFAAKVRHRSHAVVAAVALSLSLFAAPANAGVDEPAVRADTDAAALAAAAGTLVYIKDFDVWIARGDGSGARALTTRLQPRRPRKRTAGPRHLLHLSGRPARRPAHLAGPVRRGGPRRL